MLTSIPLDLKWQGQTKNVPKDACFHLGKLSQNMTNDFKDTNDDKKKQCCHENQIIILIVRMW